MVCKFCEDKPTVSWSSNWCSNCARLRRLITLYGARVYEICDKVLLRTLDQQNNKIAYELKVEEEVIKKINEDEKKKLIELRNGKKV